MMILGRRVGVYIPAMFENKRWEDRSSFGQETPSMATYLKRYVCTLLHSFVGTLHLGRLHSQAESLPKVTTVGAHCTRTYAQT